MTFSSIGAYKNTYLYYMKLLTRPVRLIDKEAELIETFIIGSIKMEELILVANVVIWAETIILILRSHR